MWPTTGAFISYILKSENTDLVTVVEKVLRDYAQTKQVKGRR